MEIDSPIGNLIKTIKQVVEASTRYESKLLKNEAATRATLIDPIIRSLGWDTSNPDLVEFERNSNNTILDYALYDSSGKVKIIVEAKALGGNLNDTNILLKLVSYCLTYGISNLFLTNGIVWQHFYNLQPGNITPVTIDFLKNPLIDCASYLINQMDAARFWTVDIKPVETWKAEQVLQIDKRKKSEPVQPVKEDKPIQVENKTVPLIQSHEFVPLSSLSKDLKGKKPPVFLRLPDGSEKSIKHWRDILSETVLYVLEKNPDITVPLSDRAGKKVNLLGLVPPDQRVTFIDTTYQARQIYIYLNYDSSNCIANALYILNFLPDAFRKAVVGVSF
jgi:hypothetical protein